MCKHAVQRTGFCGVSVVHLWPRGRRRVALPRLLVPTPLSLRFDPPVLEAVLVVVEVEQVAPVGDRAVGVEVVQLQSDLAATPGGPRTVPAAPPHAVAAPVVVVEGADAAHVCALGEVIVRAGVRPATQHAHHRTIRVGLLHAVGCA